MGTKALGKKKIFLFVGGTFLIVILLWFLANLSIIFGSQDKSYRSIDASYADIIENSDGTTDIYFHDGSGVYIGRLIFDIDLDTETPTQINVEATIADSGEGDGGVYDYGTGDETHDDGITGDGLKTISFSDKNPIYVGREHLGIYTAHIESLHIEADGASLGSFAIDNSLSFSPYLIGFGILVGIGLMGLILWRKFFALRIHAVFLLIALSLGISMVTTLPRMRVGYDEETHLQAVFSIASFPSFKLSLSPEAFYQLSSTDYSDPTALPETWEEASELNYNLSQYCNYKTGTLTPEFQIILNRIPAYLCMAMALKAAKFFSLSWDYLILVVRLTNLLTYVALMYFAIKLLPMPIGKALMIFIGLLPQNIFMACTCSYDPFIIGSLSLGYAFMFKGRKYLIPMLLSFILGVLPKAVYAPVILLGGVMILNLGKMQRKNALSHPFSLKNEEKDKAKAGKKTPGTNLSDKKRKFFLAGLCLLVFVVLVAVCILPAVISPTEGGDVRGGATSVSGQMAFILQDPLNYAGILIRNMLLNLRKDWLGPDCTTFMGHLVNGNTSFKGYFPAYIILLGFLILLSYVRFKRSGPGISIRLWMLLMAGAASILIYTAMYVTFTVPGSLTIAGVQGRYFIPLMFPGYLALCGSWDIRDEGTTFETKESGDLTPYHTNKSGIFTIPKTKEAGGLMTYKTNDAKSGIILETKKGVCYYIVIVSLFILLVVTIYQTVIMRFGI